MATKKKQPPMNVMERVRLHIEVKAERDELAKQALALLQAGKDKEGRAAAAKAERLDAKAKALLP